MNKISLLPVGRLGRWSVYLLMFFIVLFSISLVLVMVSNEKDAGMGDLSWDRLYLAIPIIMAWASVIASGVIGFIAIIKKKEKSLLVYIATFVGLAVLVLMILDVTVLE